MWEMKSKMTPQKTSQLLMGLEQFTRPKTLQAIYIYDDDDDDDDAGGGGGDNMVCMLKIMLFYIVINSLCTDMCFSLNPFGNMQELCKG